MITCQTSMKDRCIYYCTAEARILGQPDNTRLPHGSLQTDQSGEGHPNKTLLSQTRILDRLLKLSCILLVRTIYQSIHIPEFGPNNLTNAIEQTRNKYRVLFFSTYSLLLSAIKGAKAGSDVYDIIKKPTLARVVQRPEIDSINSQQLAEGAIVLRLQRSFYFYFEASTFIPHASSSLQKASGTCVYPTASFLRPNMFASASYLGCKEIRDTRNNEQGRQLIR